MPHALSFRYARALAGVVTGAQADAQAVADDLEIFERLLAESGDLRVALESPTIPPLRKRTVVVRLAKEAQISDVVRRFLFVLIDHRRMQSFHDIREAFQSVMDERLGVARAEVVSARPLTGAQQQEIIARLAWITGKQARARFKTDDGLIGGVMARIGSTVYDGSIRGQLDALKQRLAGVE